MTNINLTIGGATKRSKFVPKVVDVDFGKLPESTQDFLVRYGIKQYLSDATAGVETQDQFDGGIADRLKKMAEGTCGTRTSGEPKGPSDSVEVTARQMARQAIAQAVKDAGQPKPAKEAMDAAVSQLMESKQGDGYRKEAEKQIADRKARAGGLGDILKGMLTADAKAATGAE